MPNIDGVADSTKNEQANISPDSVNGRGAKGPSRKAARMSTSASPTQYINTCEFLHLMAPGDLQSDLHRRPLTSHQFANPAPLGLSAFALTTFVLSLINIHARGVMAPNIIVSAAFGYGGLVQLLAGMWEMALGNTFGATAFSSYGGFWISFAIILTPGGFEIASAYSSAGGNMFLSALGFFLIAFFTLFFTLDLAFLLLAIAHFHPTDAGAPNQECLKAGGFFGLLSAFSAWYNALAGIVDKSNSGFLIPVGHFPWSEKARQTRRIGKSELDRV